MLQVDVIASLKDNYIYAIKDQQQAVIVDPGSYDNLGKYLQDQGITHVDVLLTHGHWDHVNGLTEILDNYPNTKVFAQKEVLDVIGLRHEYRVEVPPNGEFQLQGKRFVALDTPGHCKHHYTYITENCVFCGDVLFSVGCGRVQADGDYMDLYLSIDKIKSYALNMGPEANELFLYPGHEYTLDNIQFAYSINDLSIDPRLDALQQRVLEKFAHGVGNTPVNFFEEVAYNPFLRCTSPVEFARMRALKDEFKTLESLAHQRAALLKAQAAQAAQAK